MGSGCTAVGDFEKQRSLYFQFDPTDQFASSLNVLWMSVDPFVALEHCNMVRGLVPKERLLEWSVEDGWAPLCKFLGKPVPDEPFPHANAAAGWAGRESELAKRYGIAAAQNVAVIFAVMGALGAILYSYVLK